MENTVSKKKAVCCQYWDNGPSLPLSILQLSSYQCCQSWIAETGGLFKIPYATVLLFDNILYEILVYRITRNLCKFHYIYYATMPLFNNTASYFTPLEIMYPHSYIVKKIFFLASKEMPSNRIMINYQRERRSKVK